MTKVRNLDALSSPRLKAALAYWDGKRGVRLMPSWQDMDPAEIPELQPRLMLIKVLVAPLDFQYRLIGAELRGIFHRDYTGMRFSEIPGKGEASMIWDNCEQVVLTRRPFSRALPYGGPDPSIQTYENLLLPLSSDDAAVDAILYIVDCLRRGEPTS